jgi:hypothetical protein
MYGGYEKRIQDFTQETNARGHLREKPVRVYGKRAKD